MSLEYLTYLGAEKAKALKVLETYLDMVFPVGVEYANVPDTTWENTFAVPPTSAGAERLKLTRPRGLKSAGSASSLVCGVEKGVLTSPPGQEVFIDFQAGASISEANVIATIRDLTKPAAGTATFLGIYQGSFSVAGDEFTYQSGVEVLLTRDTAGDKLVTNKYVAGTKTVLNSSNISISQLTPQRLRVVNTGAAVVVMLNGATIFSTTDADVLANWGTQSGLYLGPQTANPVAWPLVHFYTLEV